VHALHHAHLPQAAVITAACVALALALTLLLAGTLNQPGSIPAFGSPAATQVSARSTSTESRWNPSPFASLLRSPVRVPRAVGSQ
jgi:hypothetical protein